MDPSRSGNTLELRSIQEDIRACIATGAPLYNSGNARACAWLYLGCAVDVQERTEAADSSSLLAEGLRSVLGVGLTSKSLFNVVAREGALVRRQPEELAWKLRRGFDQILGWTDDGGGARELRAESLGVREAAVEEKVELGAGQAGRSERRISARGQRIGEENMKLPQHTRVSVPPVAFPLASPFNSFWQGLAMAPDHQAYGKKNSASSSAHDELPINGTTTPLLHTIDLGFRKTFLARAPDLQVPLITSNTRLERRCSAQSDCVLGLLDGLLDAEERPPLATGDSNSSGPFVLEARVAAGDRVSVVANSEEEVLDLREFDGIYLVARFLEPGKYSTARAEIPQVPLFLVLEGGDGYGGALRPVRKKVEVQLRSDLAPAAEKRMNDEDCWICHRIAFECESWRGGEQPEGASALGESNSKSSVKTSKKSAVTVCSAVKVIGLVIGGSCKLAIKQIGVYKEAQSV